MSIYSDIQDKLASFDQMMDAKLEEIRQIRNEIVQLQTKLQDEYKWGTYLHDDKRIVISAPEIIIGNVDKMGHLQGGTVSKVVVRGNKVKVEGVGNGDNNTGIIHSQATRIINQASDPGPYGVEDIVYQKSLITNIARAINLRSVEDLGTFYSDFTNVPAGIHIHSDNSMTIEANQPLDKTMAQLDKKMKNCQALGKQYDATLKQLKASINTLTKKMQDTIKLIEAMNADRANIRNNAVEYSTLNKVLHEYSGQYYALVTNYFAFQTSKAENTRQQNVLTKMKSELSSQIKRAGNKTAVLEGSISVKSTDVDVEIVDNNGTYRSDTKAGFHVNAADIRLNSREDSGKLLPDGSVTIGGQTVKIDTNDFDGDFTSGSVKIPGKGTFSLLSKNISIESVDYSLNGGEKKEEKLTAGGNMLIRTENVGIMATATDGKVTGGISLNAKDVAIAASDFQKDDKGAYKPSALAAGGKIYTTAETVAIGHATTKNVNIAADVATVQGKNEAKLAQGEIGSAPESAVIVQGGSTNVASSKNTDIYGKIGLRGETKVSAGISGPSAKFDGLQVSSGFKSPNIMDGFPGAAPGGDSKPSIAAVQMPEQTGTDVKSPEPRKVEEKSDGDQEVSTLLATVEELPEINEEETKNTDDNVNVKEEEKPKDAIEEALAEEEKQEEEKKEEEKAEEQKKEEQKETPESKEKQTATDEDTPQEKKEEEKAQGDIVERYELFIRIYKEECERLKVEYGTTDDLNALAELTTRYEMMAENVLTISKNIPAAISDAIYFIQKGLMIEPYTGNMSNSTKEKIEDIQKQLLELENKLKASQNAVDENLSPSDRINSEMVAGSAAAAAKVTEHIENILAIAKEKSGDSGLADSAANAIYMIIINNADANAQKAVEVIRELTLANGANADNALTMLQSIALLRKDATRDGINAICDITLDKEKSKETAITLIQNIGSYRTDNLTDAANAIERLGGITPEEIKDERTPLQKMEGYHTAGIEDADTENITIILENIVAIAKENLSDAEVIKEAYAAFSDIALYNPDANTAQVLDSAYAIAMESQEESETGLETLRVIAEHNPDLIGKAVEYIRNVSLGPVGTPIRTIYDKMEAAMQAEITPSEALEDIAKVAADNKGDKDVVAQAVTAIGHTAVNLHTTDASHAVELIGGMAKDTKELSEEILNVILRILEDKPEATMAAIKVFHAIGKDDSSQKDNVVKILQFMSAYNDEEDSERHKALEDLGS